MDSKRLATKSWGLNELPALRKRNQRRDAPGERLDSSEGSKLSGKRETRGATEKEEARRPTAQRQNNTHNAAKEAKAAIAKAKGGSQ